jgi:hypothetical protein
MYGWEPILKIFLVLYTFACNFQYTCVCSSVCMCVYICLTLIYSSPNGWGNRMQEKWIIIKFCIISSNHVAKNTALMYNKLDYNMHSTPRKWKQKIDSKNFNLNWKMKCVGDYNISSVTSNFRAHFNFLIWNMEKYWFHFRKINLFFCFFSRFRTFYT